MKKILAGILFLAAPCCGLPSLAAGNLLRNGSFEGALLYWHNISTNQQLTRDARCGEHALRIERGGVMSAPFACERGRHYTVSFFVKGAKPCTVDVQMPPGAREVAVKAKRLWSREATKSAKVGTEWQRVSFTWPADVPPNGFWPNPTYMVQIEPRGGPVIVDGVTVTEGDRGADDYVPRREIEVVVECPDLPGYAGAAGNLFEKGATVRVTAHVANTTRESRLIRLVWQFRDYEGDRIVSTPVMKTVQIEAGKTASETVALALTNSGCVLAEVSARFVGHTRSSDNLPREQIYDVSQLPLTTLPYPKAATKPDFQERFGGSFAGGQGMLEKFQRIGFGWTRWFPETKWHNFQKSADAPFDWHDDAFDLAERHGVSQHVVLYGWPPGLMDKEHSGQPLPLDMKWPADDPRWEDLSVETAWDRYVKAAVAHFRGRSVVFEIENEPELDKWDNHKEQYVRFTMRTARLIRQTDPQAKIMVNNVYGIPSGLNAAFFKAGGLQLIDVMSWHDYHEGWLTDAAGIRRMRQMMDEAGGGKVEIWFNEGWAFVNTAVDESPACTSLTSAQGCNAIMDSVAEMSAAGQKKTILFHTGYEHHGMSFWDYSGPGTMLWDWYDLPTPLVAAWNVLNHHIGRSDEVGIVRPPGANVCIFEDRRNERGVMIAYANRDAKEDAVIDLPDFGAPLVAEDIMGNAAPAPGRLVLPKSGRPAVLYSEAKTPGRVFLEKLAPLDRRNASFVSGSGTARAWSLPQVWEGATKGLPEGSTALDAGKPVWKLEQIWPPDPLKRESYRPMVWNGTDWHVAEGGFGGQPTAVRKDQALQLNTRAPHGQPQAQARLCSLAFVAPAKGRYVLGGTVDFRMWEGRNRLALRLLKRTATELSEVSQFVLESKGRAALSRFAVELDAGEEFLLVPQIDGLFNGGETILRDLRVTLAGTAAGPAGNGTRFTLPQTWDGATGNPATAAGRPVWRLDQLWPPEPDKTASYRPLVWRDGWWRVTEGGFGGQPKAETKDDGIRLEFRGPHGQPMAARICGLCFIAPQAGGYTVSGAAALRLWDGDIPVDLALLQKAANGITELESLRLARDKAVPLPALTVTLAAGDELVFLPRPGGAFTGGEVTLDDLIIAGDAPP